MHLHETFGPMHMDFDSNRGVFIILRPSKILRWNWKMQLFWLANDLQESGNGWICNQSVEVVAVVAVVEFVPLVESVGNVKSNINLNFW